LVYQGKKKGSYGGQSRSNRSIYSVQAARSSRSKALDSAFKAPLAKTDEQWMNDPSHYDWPNIDTPKPKMEDLLKDPRSKAEIYWDKLNPAQRVSIMNNVPTKGLPIMQRYKLIMKYIEQNDLMNKPDPVIEKKLVPQIVETKKTEVLIQPEIVKVNSIPEVISEGPPSKAKTYATGGQSFEVLEPEYISRQIEKNKNRYSANIKWCEEQITRTGKDSTLSERKKIADATKFMSNIDFSKRMLERLDKPESRAAYEHNYKEEYIKFIKDSIKHGKPVPEEVIRQRPEFRVAQDARRRYEKGLHTSFANKSAAINAVMFLEKGYKVKRQDGKSIGESQIREIDQGVNDIQQAVGSAKDIMAKSDLTIAHTSGTYPFLMVAGGLYHPVDKTITMGVFGLKSLAHEWAHWLDYEGGQESKYGYEWYSNGKTSKKIPSLRTALSKAEESTNPLYGDAAWHMNDPYKLRDVWKKAYGKSKEVSPEERKDARKEAARIGGYWRDPREIWDRLVEQYIAVSHGKKTEAAESPEYYYKHPAYWSREKFGEMQPIIKSELERRISNARGA
jgi:hypothetical protein